MSIPAAFRMFALGIIDTGTFAKLFTNDVINVSFQPRWTEYIDADLDQSPLYFYVDVTDTANGVQNTYANLQSPANSTTAYFFPLSVVGGGTLLRHVDGTLAADSGFTAQFTTNDPTFAPNQTIDQAFSVLADVNLEQLSAPYQLSSVVVTPGSSNPSLDQNILRLSRRTNVGSDGYAAQTIFNLPTNATLGVPTDSQGATRPSFLGALGQTSYDVTFGALSSPGSVPVKLQDGSTIFPATMPITVSLTNCPQAVLREVPTTTKDTADDMTTELDRRFYSNQTINPKTGGIYYNDPDTMHVTNPGWYEMAAFHYTDAAAFNQAHTNASFVGQGVNSGATVGPYYFPIGSTGNMDTASGAANPYHVVVHKLSVGGAEIIFNAPEVPDAGINETGDTIAGSVAPYNAPHTNDFAPGDKVTIAFTGMMKNLPFPGAQFQIKTQSGPSVNFANSNNYINSILAQVQVVPNPYIVTHIGQTSTDDAKLFFTRLPPRCTIEIYALDGTLVNTIEHIGYNSTTTTNETTAQTTTTYDYNTLSDQSSVETWNLLTSGRQRVGSQVLFARVIARDPNSNNEIGEITTKFAVVVGLSK